MIAEPFTREVPHQLATVTHLHPARRGRRSYQIAKRSRDVVVASLLLAVLSPLLLLIAILIKATSPGNVLFVQTRCGRGGSLFRCYKFRTMVPNAHWILENDQALQSSFLEHWKLVHDPRITPIGRILRKTSLDELPQLWNVLKGDMSLVGPRPVQPDELRDRYGHHAEIVTLVRPGMTGLWQVSGRSSLPYDERVALDVLYVHRRTFWYDLTILLRTIPAVLISKGAQ